MNIRAKILSGFAVMVAVVIIIGVVGLSAIIRLDNITTELREVQHENVSISRVLNAHYVWKQQLTESVMTGHEFTGALDPHSCSLGQWYDSEEAEKMDNRELLDMLERLDAPHELMHNEAKEVVALTRAGKADEAKDYLENIIFPQTTVVISILTDMQAHYTGIVVEKDNESVRIAKLMEIVNIALIIAAIFLCVFLALILSSRISKPLVALSSFMKKASATGDITLHPEDLKNIQKYSQTRDEIGESIASTSDFIKYVTQVAQALETIASGDLTCDIRLISEADTMGKSLKYMVDSLNQMFREINESANQVAFSSRQIAMGAQSLAEASAEQSASITQLSDSVTEITEKTAHNSETAEKATELADTIMGNAEKGNRQMDEMMAAARAINQASKDISKVMKAIDDIAFQTNILALNAGIEAARSGEHGKGFSVVAEEVRELAGRSVEAAKQTSELIQNSMEKAELGARIAEETAASLAEIVSGINHSNSFIKEITLASEEQSHDINHINEGIDQVTFFVHQNSATSEESAAASEEMSAQADMLQQMIGRFKLKE